jgi:hypothetical protein
VEIGYASTLDFCKNKKGFLDAVKVAKAHYTSRIFALGLVLDKAACRITFAQSAKERQEVFNLALQDNQIGKHTFEQFINKSLILTTDALPIEPIPDNMVRFYAAQ